MGKKYGYVRVSTRGQAENGNGLQAQREAVISHGANAELIFEDIYTGAMSKGERPKLTRLMGLLQRGDTLIIPKLDRVSRSVEAGAKFIRELVEKGVTIDVLNIGVFDNRPANKFQLHVILAMAEFERDLIRERLQEGKAIARQAPDYTEGRPPKWTKKQYDHAMKELERHSYKEVSAMVGIPVPTLKIEKRRRKDTETKNGA
jgi:DNA invertase Pin-like site-specific DNA recombinase